MLTVLTFLPFAAGGLILLLPRRRDASLRFIAILAAATTFVIGALLMVQLAQTGTAVRQQAAWIPSIGASYALGFDGLSAPLVLLTTLLGLLVLFDLPASGEDTKELLFLFLTVETGVLGVFLASDLLLFYVFWEVALVPLYFIIGIWGHEGRREAALKFFLYTRAGSLALLLAILALYFRTEPRSFDLDAITAAGRASGSGTFAALVLLGFALGFGVKLPIVPLHSWLPDAHVEAPTAGSVMLAGVLLKMGGYGSVRIAVGAVPAAFQRFAGVFIAIAVIGIVYGAAVAMAQRDFKRLVAYTSINHMGFVLLGATLAVTGATAADRTLAVNGAIIQMVSHGLLTGGMFLLVGMLQERMGTRDLMELGGLWGRTPVFAGVLTAFAFASFGLPVFSGFVGEFQVFVAAVARWPWAAAAAAFGVIISTALYLRALQQTLFNTPTARSLTATDLSVRERGLVGVLLAASVFIGVAPGLLISIVERGARTLLGQ